MFVAAVWATGLRSLRTGEAYSTANNINHNIPPLTTIATVPNARRSLCTSLIAAATSAALLGGRSPALADSTTPLQQSDESVYFGVGCFWHIQHEFVEAERTLLKRSDRQLTSLTGYAGGNKKFDMPGFDRVCYHNFQQVADYGRMGHGEVVGMQLPTDKIVEFSQVYFSLFNPKTLGMLWLLFFVFVISISVALK